MSRAYATTADRDALRAERDDWVQVARIGRGPERYVRFSPDYTESQRRLAAEAFRIDLGAPWHDCHPDAPGSNGCQACAAGGEQ